MNIIKNKYFSPSVNILRDDNSKLDYTSTSNAEQVIDILNKNISKGFRSYTIVGSFGTGKSIFLLALERYLNKGEKIFQTPLTFNGKINYEFLKVIGDFTSLEIRLGEILNKSPNEDLFKRLEQRWYDLSKKGKGLVIVIDEFGKFLEYASENSAQKEMYFIQKLAEFCNDGKKNIILLTTLHQNFDSYKSHFKNKNNEEWQKVKGRFYEIIFNEPVEQLLSLAAKRIINKNHRIDENFHLLYKSIIYSKAYPLLDSLSEEKAKQFYPIDILSSAVLATSFKRYGQNERSLFTFLSTADFKKLNHADTPYFNLATVYDYLIQNFYSFIYSRFNEDYFKWSIIKHAIERVESSFSAAEIPGLILIIKTIGILNIFARAGALINHKFIEQYGKYALGLINTNEMINFLEKKKIIKYRTYSDTFILFEGTDLNIELALKDADNKISFETDVVKYLINYFDFPVKPAKGVYLEKGSPRFFEYILSNNPINKKPEGEVDGIVNLIFNESLSEESLLTHSLSNKEAVLYVFYKQAKEIKEKLYEIEKVTFVIENNIDDRVAYRELRYLKNNLIVDLNKLISVDLFMNKEVKWIYNGKGHVINTSTDFTKLLSTMCNEIYFKTPIFHNELINREKLPASISSARKNLILKIFENYREEDLGFQKDSFPPEKAIYLKLLKEQGIHRQENELWTLSAPNQSSSLSDLWEECIDWLNSCKRTRRTVKELYTQLAEKPYKMKKGFLDFWIPIFLYINKDEFAFYEDDTFLSIYSSDLIDNVLKKPKSFYVKAFDVRGLKLNLFNKYRVLINKDHQTILKTNTFLDTLRPFIKFYKSLPEYSKRTQRLPTETKKFREAIAQAKDPEKIFFEDFPKAMGYSSVKLYESEQYLEQYVTTLQNNIRTLRICYEELLNRIESYVLNIFGVKHLSFKEYKVLIQKRYLSIKKHLLLPHQKSFHIRIISELDDKEAWFNSIVHSLLSKSLDNISDEDEELLYEKLSSIFHELDNLCEFSNLQIDDSKEDAIKVEINQLHKKVNAEIIRLSKDQLDEISDTENIFRYQLNKTKNKKLRKYILLKLLNEELVNG